jgi:hypothetical protein
MMTAFPVKILAVLNRERRTFAVFLALLLLSVFVNLATALITRAHITTARLDADELEYYNIAGRILDGTYELEPRRVIGHALVLSFLRFITGDRLLLVQIGVTLLFSFTAPLTYCLVRRELGHQGAALTAGLGIIFWPLFVIYGSTLYSETLALPCFIALLLLLPGGLKNSVQTHGIPGWKQASRLIVAGMALGLCMHVRPMYLLFTPFLVLIVGISVGGMLRAIAPVALVLAGAVLVVAPWSTVLSRHEGKIVILSSNQGENLGGGFTPELLRRKTDVTRAPGGRATWVGPGKFLPPNATGYLTPEEMGKPTSIRDQIEKDRAVTWILSHPRDVAYLSLRKLSYMWGIYPVWNGVVQTLLGNIPTLLLLCLSGVAIVRFRRSLRPLLPFLLLPIFVSCVAIVSWGSWRFREPGDVGLLVIVSALPWSANILREIRGTGTTLTPSSRDGQSEAAAGASSIA